MFECDNIWNRDINDNNHSNQNPPFPPWAQKSIPNGLMAQPPTLDFKIASEE